MKMMIIVGHYLLNLVNLLLLLLLIIRMDKFPTSIVSPKAHKNYPQLSCQETWVRVWVRGCYFLKKGTLVRRGCCIYIYVIVTSYMHVDFFVNYESWFIIINSMIIWTMNIQIENLKHKKLINYRLSRYQLEDCKLHKIW